MRKILFAGLKPLENPQQRLLEIYESTLMELKKLPESPYVLATTQLTKERMEITKNAQSLEEIEQKIGESPVEFIVDQAEAEYNLMNKL